MRRFRQTRTPTRMGRSNVMTDSDKQSQSEVTRSLDVMMCYGGFRVARQPGFREEGIVIRPWSSSAVPRRSSQSIYKHRDDGGS